MWPSNTTHLVTSPYGYRIHPVTGKSRFHAGIDIGAAYGTSILAANDGVVIVAGYNAGGYGNYVAVDHGTVKGERIKAYYAHMDSVAVPNGASVKQGQVLGYVGTTGSSTGYHLHFGIMKNDSWVNPMNYYSSTK